MAFVETFVIGLRGDRVSEIEDRFNLLTTPRRRSGQMLLSN